jgi:predicted nucleic-acid-binding protein
LRITADTNVLLRAAVDDDPVQSQEARQLLQNAERLALTLPVLCEFVWVMRRVYRRRHEEISASLKQLIAASNTMLDVAAVEAGLATLDAGGDFADGVIAFVGRQMGGTILASFDREAVALIAGSGGETHLLGEPAT